ncbi:hypothetical protein B0H63DRAFT_463056 [Podospora didyma]|uniref:Uncharacterized protein n=1 Tax=Podospora didyma TaxID=330526 RepID=A0AAE0U3C6_9PEZI|nr:hypothetical protein B0H63DRAFT_463056 [Podospora didyma]
MQLKYTIYSLFALTATALPHATGELPTRGILAPRDQCAAAGPECTGEKWSPDCPGGYCMPFQGPHIGFWCCP